MALVVQGAGTLGTPLQIWPAGIGVTGSQATQVMGKAIGGNTSNTATLAAAAGKFTYISGFSATGAGSTAALNVTITTAGLSSVLDWTFTFPAGATTAATPVTVYFSPPLKSSAVNTAITVNLPAGGAGNTDASISAWGFQQ